MDGYSSKKNEVCPQLLELISNDREWGVKRGEGVNREQSEENKLELRLGPPCEDWTIYNGSARYNNSRGRDESLLSLTYYSSSNKMTITSGAKRGFLDTTTVGQGTMENSSSKWIARTNNCAGSQTNQKLSDYQVKSQVQEQTKGLFLQAPSNPSQAQSSSAAAATAAVGKESSQPCYPKVLIIDLKQQSAEERMGAAFSPASPAAITAVPNSSQKRPAAAAPVVGWPPVRSFRRNLASSSSSSSSLKQNPESENGAATKKQEESCQKGLFVKINMDGVPIGRKVNLISYDSYEKLCSAVDVLFRDLLAVQMDSSAGGTQNKHVGEQTITGLLDGSGEYTLVYEDNEGDRMLVGDVPWNMFVSTVKRLRVLKSSELSSLLSCTRSKQGKEKGWGIQLRHEGWVILEKGQGE